MKKYICMALVFALAVCVLTGCGCANRNVSDNPGGLITKPTTAPTTNPMPTMTTPPEETTTPTTVPHTGDTVPETLIPGGTGSAPTDMTDGTGSATEGTGTGRMMPRRVR